MRQFALVLTSRSVLMHFSETMSHIYRNHECTTPTLIVLSNDALTRLLFHMQSARIRSVCPYNVPTHDRFSVSQIYLVKSRLRITLIVLSSLPLKTYFLHPVIARMAPACPV